MESCLHSCDCILFLVSSYVFPLGLQSYRRLSLLLKYCAGRVACAAACDVPGGHEWAMYKFEKCRWKFRSVV